MKINNYDEIHDELVEMMIDLDADQCEFEIDVYLYVDEEGNGSLYQFANPGGNSWLNDDHITIYTDGPHYDDYYEDFYTYDEDGDLIPYSRDELREYLEEYRAEYSDKADLYLGEAEIEPA